jgi:hypothetical protein
VHRFEFPGYIPPSELKFETLEPVDRKTLHHPSRHTLNEIYATAICGNDLTSSVLYVIGVTTTLSGQLAPLCLLAVGLVLYLFKSVYGEVRTVGVGVGMGVLWGWGWVGVSVSGGGRGCERAIRTERPVRLLVCLALPILCLISLAMEQQEVVILQGDAYTPHAYHRAQSCM